MAHFNISKDFLIATIIEEYQYPNQNSKSFLKVCIEDNAFDNDMFERITQKLDNEIIPFFLLDFIMFMDIEIPETKNFPPIERVLLDDVMIINGLPMGTKMIYEILSNSILVDQFDLFSERSGSVIRILKQNVRNHFFESKLNDSFFNLFYYEIILSEVNFKNPSLYFRVLTEIAKHKFFPEKVGKNIFECFTIKYLDILPKNEIYL